MKLHLTTAIILLSQCLYAQEAQQHLDKARTSLIQAEWAFINLAKETNTRDAFVANFTDETIVINGNAPVNAKKMYESVPVGEGYLKWQPEYTDIAASGDFGFNTGPWEFRAKKTDEQPVAYGHFVSVWKKEKDSQWKLLFDGGVSHPKPVNLPSELSTSAIPTGKPSKKTSNVSSKTIMDVEAKFVSEHSKDLQSAYKKYLSSEARVYRVGFEPFVAKEKALAGTANDPAINYITMGGDISSSGDFVFVYGTAEYKLSTGALKKAAYSRIWKLENGKEWKIIADVLTYR